MSLPKPFSIQVDDEVLQDLVNRLETVRLAPELRSGKKLPSLAQAQAGRHRSSVPDESYYGISMTFFKNVLDQWRTQFLSDWRTREAELNKLNQYTVEVEPGVEIHFIHEKAKQPSSLAKSIPIILCHGWPSTVFDFENVIPLLTERGFDVVVPSLCGFCFSTSKSAFGPSDNARLFHKLMVNCLGYRQYLAHGGDWGYHVACFMGLQYAECIALHLSSPTGSLGGSFSLVDLNKTIRMGVNIIAPSLTLPPREASAASRLKSAGKHAGYFLQQWQKPDTLGHGMLDSPAGLLAYIMEKFIFNTWVPEDNIKNLLTTVTLYWVSNCALTGFRFYREAVLAGDIKSLPTYLNVPTGILNAPGDILQYPSAITHLSHDVRSYTYAEKGGHFIALEEPQLVAEDISNFVFNVIDFEKECGSAALRNSSRNPPFKKQMKFSAPLLPVAIGAVGLTVKMIRSRL